MTALPPCIVADIGGTNTRVARVEDGAVQPASIKRYRNADHPGIEPVLRDYLAQGGPAPHAVCVDMAGPVKNGVGRLTNRDWRVDATALRTATGASTVAVLNDMQAQGMAVGGLGPDGLLPLIPPAADAEPGENAPRLVVNVGTGLNAQPVYHIAGRTLVPPAEAGHVSIPVQTEDELRLRDWVAATLGEGSPGLEELLSGRGLEHVHGWICAEAGAPGGQGAAEIFAAFTAGDALAGRAAAIVVRLLGRYAGDLALVTQPVGGVFLVGGVIGHLGPHLGALGFAEAFRDKGRFADFMDQFPVYVVQDDYAALAGCAAHLREILAAPD